MILLYTILFIVLIAGISHWVTYIPKMPLIPQEPILMCPFCKEQLEGSSFFIDCPNRKSLNITDTHQFTIYAGDNFSLFIYFKLFTVKLMKREGKYSLSLGNKHFILKPFEMCDSLDVINKYLKLTAFL